jgi:ubiquinone/menaquinone biosynthesis C-methylase UbiE
MGGSAFLNPEHLMDAASVRFGHHVADIGTGRTGHLVFPLAGRVGDEGKVYAVDIDPECVQMVESLRRQRGAMNLHPVWGDAEDQGSLAIPAASLDVAFLVNALWSMKQHAEVAQELGRLMKDSGRIFVMDWRENSLHPLAPHEDYRQHPELIDVSFAAADWYPRYEVRISPHHWARAYERL